MDNILSYCGSTNARMRASENAALKVSLVLLGLTYNGGPKDDASQTGKLGHLQVWYLLRKKNSSAQRCVLPVSFLVHLLLWQQ